MREVVRELRSIDWRTGRLLWLLSSRSLEAELGFESFADYVRERLGMSLRRARSLLAIERQAERSPAIARAYREGRLSWLRTLALLPVADDGQAIAAEWVERARQVTLRRLIDEVGWALEWRVAVGADSAPRPPVLGERLERAWSVPAGSALSSPGEPPPAAWSPDVRTGAGGSFAGEVQMHTGSDGPLAALRTPDGEPVAAAVQMRTGEESRGGAKDGVPGLRRIEFSAPASVIAFFRAAVGAWTGPGEQSWRGLERLLRHALGEWERAGRHRDPVFARDGWRCAVPGCSSRRNLHDHHIRFRSHGGGNEPQNRISHCAAHHLHGIHDGTVRCSGRAPDAVLWELGVLPDGRVLLRLRGDVYLEPAPQP